ncbi:3-deoxy-D-arabinoheptulosonate-7-phosphate synthase [Thermosporothrix hazakensis]|jgi:3-deoxy-7-phosphoheptulonate synthase|uniref:3-deoxy-D-arabinoheptulosonate-7-phosphate synthase n=1 Tax=Thermosporothrix hazakensis TaxID=644383 RepID=A0A326TR16_THEHA|nr:3-deoxy-7-phosphoheptulonate synthase [Thermosporothrix hazakensis]PZW18286.1 3-deoxy-D-arabinoheptulosonate-7-phosphate synthase [Thermosporothrix hazakensis]GCE49248.1 3-deoxy-7-phosphoheptulonate synthase [Thermosporothrix hazakensis]
MIVMMHTGCKPQQIQQVLSLLEDRDLIGLVTQNGETTVIGVLRFTGENQPPASIDPAVPALEELAETLELLPGVQRVERVTTPYKLASRAFHPANTCIHIAAPCTAQGVLSFGGQEVIMMAGPCTVENEKQLMRTAEAIRKAGAVVLRGGAFKPSTSPYGFRGLGEKGLQLLARAREAFGMPVITEVMTPTDVPLVSPYADILQIGTRNMQNYMLLDEVGRTQKPVLLKRGMSATIEEWLLAAEYILAQGNPHVILCERGIRTFERATRNTMDISAIPLVKKLSHLPVIADPSQGTGMRELVTPLALAAVAAGADGLLVEVHPIQKRR